MEKFHIFLVRENVGLKTRFHLLLTSDFVKKILNQFSGFFFFFAANIKYKNNVLLKLLGITYFFLGKCGWFAEDKKRRKRKES